MARIREGLKDNLIRFLTTLCLLMVGAQGFTLGAYSFPDLSISLDTSLHQNVSRETYLMRIIQFWIFR